MIIVGPSDDWDIGCQFEINVEIKPDVLQVVKLLQFTFPLQSPFNY